MLQGATERWRNKCLLVSRGSLGNPPGAESQRETRGREQWGGKEQGCASHSTWRKISALIAGIGRTGPR